MVEEAARRLGLSRFTVNQYTKALFRHFGVESRAEADARDAEHAVDRYGVRAKRPAVNDRRFIQYVVVCLYGRPDPQRILN